MLIKNINKIKNKLIKQNTQYSLKIICRNANSVLKPYVI